MSFEGIDIGNIPEHVAVIMDGNGRWAQKKGGIRSMGHQEGVNAVRQPVEGDAGGEPFSRWWAIIS